MMIAQHAFHQYDAFNQITGILIAEKELEFYG